MPHFLSICLLVVLSQLSYCSTGVLPSDSLQSTESKATESQASRRQMARRSAWRSPSILLVASGKTEADEAFLFEMLSDIARFRIFDKQLVVAKASALNEAVLGNSTLMLMGNKVPEKVWAKLGTDGPQNFRAQDLTRPGWWLRSFGLENPWAPSDTSLAINLFYAEDVKLLRSQLYANYANDEWEDLLRTRYGYLVDEQDQARIKGFFSDDTWRPDPDRELIFQAAGEPVYSDQQVRFFTPDGAPPKARLQEIASLIGTQKATMAEWFGLDSTPTLDLHLYPNLERITLRLQEMQEVQFDHKEHQIHLSLAELATDLNSSEWYFCLLQWFRQRPEVKKLTEANRYLDRGLSVLLKHEGKPPGLQDATLWQGKKILNKEQLLTTNRLDFGPYLYDYAAAAQLTTQPLATVRQQLGLPGLPDRFLNTQAKAWEASTLNFQAGMTLAHEGYQVINGYGGGTVDASLDSMAWLGVNSIAVVPYGFQRHPNKLPELRVESSAGGENNAATRSSIRRAQQKGWSVMLKPQIWVGSGSWPGDIDFESEQEWEQWFQRYTEWVLNFALLAAEEKVASLCIGTELRYTTLKHPDKWRQLIRCVRAVYPGTITYAANWGDEFEQLSFWDQLDVIGLNSYYPLTAEVAPSNNTLEAGAQNWVEKAEAKAEAFGKKWWLTEVGYRSVDRAWVNPHADVGDRSPNEMDQARCYAALLPILQEAPNFSGMYVWKWPSYLGRGNNRRFGKVGFTPGGKPAARLLKAFYASKVR